MIVMDSIPCGIVLFLVGWIVILCSYLAVIFLYFYLHFIQGHFLLQAGNHMYSQYILYTYLMAIILYSGTPQVLGWVTGGEIAGGVAEGGGGGARRVFPTGEHPPGTVLMGGSVWGMCGGCL